MASSSSGVLLVLVAQLLDVLVPVQRVVVEVRLGVEGDDVAAAGDQQGVDLQQRAVEVDVGLVELGQEAGHAPGDLALEAELRGDVPGLVAEQAKGRIDRDPRDLLGVLGGDLLDVHPALARGHDGDPTGVPVEGRGEVELLGDVHALLDEQAVDDLALFAGLDRDQGAAEHLAGDVLGHVGALDDLDAAELRVLLEAALAAAASVDLRLDDDDLVARLFDELSAPRARPLRPRTRPATAARGRPLRAAAAWPDIRGSSWCSLLVGEAWFEQA